MSSDFDPVAHISSVMQGYAGQRQRFGLRADDEAPAARVGGDVPRSRVWKNGSPTNRLLTGTSSIGIRSSDPKDVVAALKKLGGSPSHYYYGQHVSLIHGPSYHAGTDNDERVIHGAKLAGHYEKAGSDSGLPVKVVRSAEPLYPPGQEAAEPGGQTP